MSDTKNWQEQLEAMATARGIPFDEFMRGGESNGIPLFVLAAYNVAKKKNQTIDQVLDDYDRRLKNPSIPTE